MIYRYYAYIYYYYIYSRSLNINRVKSVISIGTVGSIIEGVNSRSIGRTTIRVFSIALHMCLCDSFISRSVQYQDIKRSMISTLNIGNVTIK